MYYYHPHSNPVTITSKLHPQKTELSRTTTQSSVSEVGSLTVLYDDHIPLRPSSSWIFDIHPLSPMET